MKMWKAKKTLPVRGDGGSPVHISSEVAVVNPSVHPLIRTTVAQRLVTRIINRFPAHLANSSRVDHFLYFLIHLNPSC